MILHTEFRGIHWVSFLLVLWLGFPTVQGQELMDFSLDESIRYALSNNKEIQNARFDEYIAQARVKEILASGYPQIRGSADMQYFVELPTSILPAAFNTQQEVVQIGDSPYLVTPIDQATGQPKFGDPVEVQFGFPWQSTIGVQAQQLIADGVFFIGLKGAKTYVETAQIATNRTQEETALAVSKAYYQALIAEEQLSLLEANLSRVNRLFAETKALNEEGFAEKIDVDRLQINVTNLQLEQERVKRLVELSKNLLKFQMGLPITTDIRLIEQVDDFTTAPTPTFDFSTFNLDNRVEYRLLRSQRELQTYNAKRFRASLFPSLYAFGSYQYNAQRDEFNFFDNNQSWFPISVVGLQLNVPIFDGLKSQAQYQQTQLTLKKLDNQTELLQNSIYLELSNAQTTLQNAYTSLSRYQDNIDLAKKVFEVAQIKYKEGVGSSLEVNEAESQLKEAESFYLNGLFEFLMAQLDWQKAQGQFSKYHTESE